LPCRSGSWSYVKRLLRHQQGVMPSASPQECLGIILGAPGSSPAPEATLERGAPSKGSYTTSLEEVY